MATLEIDGAHGLLRDINTFADEIQQVLHEVDGKIIGNEIKPASAQRYAHRLIKRLNINEEGEEGQKLRTRTGLIKVSGLSHKRSKKSDPRLTWFMFHKIYCIYSDIKNK